MEITENWMIWQAEQDFDESEHYMDFDIKIDNNIHRQINKILEEYAEYHEDDDSFDLILRSPNCQKEMTLEELQNGK
jgi:hypothetical protein